MQPHLLTCLLFLLYIPLIPILLIGSSRASLVSHRCREDQQSLLLQLKRSLNFNSSSSQKLARWNESTDCCGWPGIRCDPDGLGRVTGLNLSREFINGGGGLDKSKALFSLRYLEDLDLSYNKFNTTIPSALSNLTNLRYLDLAEAGFRGQIPIAISQLTSLISLNLSYQSLKLEKPNLAVLVQNLTQLIELRLSQVYLSAQGKDWSQVLSSSLPSLKVLIMRDCSLSGPIHTSLSNLQSLSVLQLDNNYLISSPVPDSLSELKSLTIISLGSCNLIGTFPSKIFQIPSLELVDLSSNSLLKGSFPDFPQNHSMKTLILSYTNFTGILPPSIGNLGKLTWIEIIECNFMGAIPKPMESLHQLEHLDFSSNRFTILAPSLRFFKNLVYLDLSYNQLAGYFPLSVFEVGTLESLFLQCNKFSGSVQLSWFRPFQNLNRLDLSYNNLTVDASGYSSSTSSIFPQFSTLQLASSNMRMLPELGNQSRLFYLDLSDNNINGLVSRWILESTTLEHLNLSHNNLAGFEVNPVSFSTINYLDLHDNQLKGDIPNIPSSSFLSYVDYSHNLFSGSIPADSSNYRYVEYLSLSNNSLTGAIPTSICNASYVEVLDLSNNNLNGTIPSCIIEDIIMLVVLDLRGNKLSGEIPDTFPASCFLKTLDLNNNQLQGSVPKSIQNCSMLEVLDLGNNKISDVFPCFLGFKSGLSVFHGDNSSLSVLILRNNLFQGNVWCSPLQGSWQTLQIVDLAFNNFSGPLNVEYLATWKAMMGGERGKSGDHLAYGPFMFGDKYYQDSVTVSIKGSEFTYEKILRVFNSIDFAGNNFDGPIPEVIGRFKALQVLNFSHNTFTGHIPSVFGNLTNMESLDLSDNKLSGKIPTELGGLPFLSCMNLSDNNLVGSIPTGPQLQTFENTSYEGNPNLCGFPLSRSCTPPPAPVEATVRHKRSFKRINWDFLSKTFGYIFGLAAVMLPAALWPSFRVWYWPKIDSLLLWMFPKMYVKDWNNRLRQRQRRSRPRGRQ